MAVSMLADVNGQFLTTSDLLHLQEAGGHYVGPRKSKSRGIWVGSLSLRGVKEETRWRPVGRGAGIFRAWKQYKINEKKYNTTIANSEDSLAAAYAYYMVGVVISAYSPRPH